MLGAFVYSKYPTPHPDYIFKLKFCSITERINQNRTHLDLRRGLLYTNETLVFGKIWNQWIYKMTQTSFDIRKQTNRFYTN